MNGRKAVGLLLTIAPLAGCPTRAQRCDEATSEARSVWTSYRDALKKRSLGSLDALKDVLDDGARPAKSALSQVEDTAARVELVDEAIRVGACPAAQALQAARAVKQDSDPLYRRAMSASEKAAEVCEGVESKEPPVFCGP